MGTFILDECTKNFLEDIKKNIAMAFQKKNKMTVGEFCSARRLDSL